MIAVAMKHTNTWLKVDFMCKCPMRRICIDCKTGMHRSLPAKSVVGIYALESSAVHIGA